jgi:hypothetical protein
VSVKISVSIGELVDKITILKIKQSKIEDSNKLEFINEELGVLTASLEQLNLQGVDSYLKELEEINLELWEIEDDIRDKERAKAFDDDFIRLARSVYITNDKRFDAKSRCNSYYGGNIQEVKSYQEY